MSEELEQYVIDHSVEELPLLKQLSREANVKLLHGRMVSGHIQGRLLSAVAHMIKPYRILEIGTYVGYSAICLAEGLPENGKLITIDKDDEIEGSTRETRKRAYASFIANLKNNYLILDSDDTADVLSVSYIQDEYLTRLQQQVINEYLERYSLTQEALIEMKYGMICLRLDSI